MGVGLVSEQCGLPTESIHTEVRGSKGALHAGACKEERCAAAAVHGGD